MISSWDEMRAIFKNKYKKKVVCFIDIMGTEDKTDQSPDKLRINNAIQWMYVGNPKVQEDELFISTFSDCMYIITEQDKLNCLLEFVAGLAYHFLVNSKGDFDKEKNKLATQYDCIKIRGGITYGDVLFMDKNDGKEEIPLLSNIVAGPAVVAAYSLESQEAVFPRVLVDDNLLKLLTNQRSSELCKYSISKDVDGRFYFDFLNYISKTEKDISSKIEGCIEFVMSEIAKALEKSDDKLVGKLFWYKSYLERTKEQLEKQEEENGKKD